MPNTDPNSVVLALILSFHADGLFDPELTKAELVQRARNMLVDANNAGMTGGATILGIIYALEAFLNGDNTGD